MANDLINPLKKETGSELNRPGAGEATAPRGACTLFQRAVIPRPDAQLQAWQNRFVTYVNGHPADLALAAGMMGAEIWGWVARASRPRTCDPPPAPPSPGWPPRKTQS